MNKDDLTTGLLVKFRDDTFGLVMINDQGDEDRILYNNVNNVSAYKPLNEYRFDLTNTLSSEDDIVQVCTDRETFDINVFDLSASWCEENVVELENTRSFFKHLYICNEKDIKKVALNGIELIKEGENNE